MKNSLSYSQDDARRDVCSGSEAGSNLRLMDFVWVWGYSQDDARRRGDEAFDHFVDQLGNLLPVREREFFIDNLLVRIHCIIMMIRWTGFAPWEFESPFSGSLISTLLVRQH